MGKRILVVEEEQRSMILFRDLLGHAGYEVLEAADGRQGVEMAGEQRPDLVLMGIKLPGMDGIEATQALRSDPATADMCIAALTATAMVDQREQAEQATRFDAYITKPIDVKEFLATVAALLSGSVAGEST